MSNNAAPGGGGFMGWLTRLVGGGEPLLALPAPDGSDFPTGDGDAGQALPTTFSIAVAPLYRDAGNTNAGSVIAALSGRPGLKCKALTHGPRLERPDDPVQLAAAAVQARQIVMDEDVDVLVWGEMLDQQTLRLRFTGGAPLDDDRPGIFSPRMRLELPVGFGAPLDVVLNAIILCAIDPINDAQRETVKILLPPLLPAVIPLGQRPPPGLPGRQQIPFLMCFAQVVASAAMLEPGSDALAASANAYRAVIRRITPNDSVADLLRMQSSLAAILMLQAEKSGDSALLEDGITTYRAVIDAFPKGTASAEWANLQNRLGLALVKLEKSTGSPRQLKEAITSFQNALQVFSRHDTPGRWAEIMHNLARAMQVYGDHTRNAEVLGRAVTACEAVLTVWTPERAPLAWAAAQNTLGAALFLHDKHRGTISNLDAAAEALSNALDVYKAVGASKLVYVTARNLDKVESLLKERRDRKVFDPNWAELSDLDD